MSEKPTEDQMVRVLAERGMGWKIAPPTSEEFKHCLTFISSEAEPSEGFHESRCYYPQPPSCVDADSFDPFTSPADAMMLMEKLSERFAVQLTSAHPGWSFQVIEHGSYTVIGKSVCDTPCLAIALAAFAALEGE